MYTGFIHKTQKAALRCLANELWMSFLKKRRISGQGHGYYSIDAMLISKQSKEFTQSHMPTVSLQILPSN